MANAVVTQSCDRACGFCFAPNDGGATMPRQRLLDLADRLRAEGKRIVPLVGGEPTLHPEIELLVLLLVERGMRVRVFTHGRIDPIVVERLARLPVGACTFVVNASASLRGDGRLERAVETTLAALGPRACLGLTIDLEARPLERLLDLYDELGLSRTLRVSLAQPVLGGTNRHHPDYRRPGLGQRITDLALQAAARSIRVDFDCGFVLCTFTAAQRDALARLGVPLRSVCGAIPDVTPDGDAWPCYPLAPSYRTRLDGHASLAAVREHLDSRLRGFRLAGLYPECRSCEHLADSSCIGGCLARVIPTFTAGSDA